MKASGKVAVYTPTAAEKLAFKQALVPVHKQMESRIGGETIKAIYEATGFNPEAL